MSKQLTDDLIDAAEGIGQFLDLEETGVLFHALIGPILAESHELKDDAMNRLTAERECMPDENRKSIDAKIQVLKLRYQRRPDIISSLNRLELWFDVPF